MAVAVSLRRVVDELEVLMDDCTAYLNRQTGEFYALQDDEAGLVEDGASLEDSPAWRRDEIPRIHEVLESEDWLPLPTTFDIHEWAIMDEFARSIDDSDLQGELLNAIRGAGAFRCFKDAIHRRGIHESWYRYRAAALGQIAIGWLDEHGISYTRDEDAASAGG